MDEIDIEQLSDNDFSVTSHVYFSKKNILQKTFLNQYMLVASLKLFAIYRVSKMEKNENYYPADLLNDCMNFMHQASMSLDGRGMNMYNQLWTGNNSMLKRVFGKKKEDKLTYD